MDAEEAVRNGIDLWPVGAVLDPGYPEVAFLDGTQHRLRNVSHPTLTPFLPDGPPATGTGVIVAPGGGFRILSWDSEGTAVCEWLRDRGIAAFLLKYRLAHSGATEADFDHDMQAMFSTIMERGVQKVADGIGPTAAEDALRSVAMVRERADEWGVRPGRLGFLGFSAGGYLATVVGVAPLAERADFVAPIYPVAPEGLVVPADAPPLFTVVATDDPICFAETVSVYVAWQKARRRAELHGYAAGGHGFGMNKTGGAADTWIERFHDWLQAEGLV